MSRQRGGAALGVATGDALGGLDGLLRVVGLLALAVGIDHDDAHRRAEGAVAAVGLDVLAARTTAAAAVVAAAPVAAATAAAVVAAAAATAPSAAVVVAVARADDRLDVAHRGG